MMFKPDTCTLAVAALIFSLSGCGTNPVTHKRELQLISESQEISIGQENYIPARQQQGGDYIVDAELIAYVQSVGNKLAAVCPVNSVRTAFRLFRAAAVDARMNSPTLN